MSSNASSIEFVEFDEKKVLPTEQDEKYVDFLNRLIALMVSKRVSMQLSQKDLARMIGISNISMCRIETRAKTPSLKTLFKLAMSLKMTAQDFAVNMSQKGGIL